MTPDRVSGADARGQLVLLAGAVLAVGLVALLLAYLQLGYAPATGGQAAPGTERVVGQLALATHEAGSDVGTAYPWGRRDAAVEAVRRNLSTRVAALNRSGLAGGVIYQVGFAPARARTWAAANCPGGPARNFGPCEAHAGVVVQERAGRTHVLAVAYDVRRAGEDRRTHLRPVLRVVPRER